MRRKEFVIFLLFLVLQTSLGLRFASYYLDEMVLQRQVHSTIWGFDALLPELESSLDCSTPDGQAMSTMSIKPGLKGENVWELRLPAFEGGTVCDVKVFDEAETILLKNIVFGDVWLCSGQSNMHFMMKDIINGSEEIEASASYTDIRYMSVGGVSPTPIEPDDSDDLKPNPGDMTSWYNSSNSDALGDYSAVCFLYARNIYEKLKVPQGLVKAECGGTEIEPWSPTEALENCDITNDPPKCNDANDPSIWHCRSILYNSKINPLKRMALKGFLWYQGEANSHFNTDEYSCTFPALIDGYRKEFSTHSDTGMKAPFGFVQLAANRPNYTSLGFPKIRWHQTGNMGTVPNERMENVFMAVALDTYDADSPTGTVHPRYKQIVAERLAIAGLNVAYGIKTYPTNGPYIQSIGLSSSVHNDGLVAITYDQNITSEDSEISGFYYCCSDFEICDDDNWMDINEVHDKGTNFVILNIEGLCPTEDNWKIPSLAYLWRETPIQGYLNAPIYSTDSYRLPGAPWKVSAHKISTPSLPFE